MSTALTLPPSVVETFIDDKYALLDNVKPSCAIDRDGQVFWSHFTIVRNSAGPALMRVFHFPPNSRVGSHVDLPFYPNAACTFIQYNNTLWLAGYHNDYVSGKSTHFVSVPVLAAACPCTIY